MAVYPGDPLVKTEILHTVQADLFNMNLLSTAMHAGTHLDAPLHFLEEGDDVAAIPLEKTIGPANLVRIEAVDGVLWTADLRKAYLGLKEKHPRLLLSTGWEKRTESEGFFTDYPAFDSVLPVFLRENGIVLL
jgi:arylformamidase